MERNRYVDERQKILREEVVRCLSADVDWCFSLHSFVTRCFHFFLFEQMMQLVNQIIYGNIYSDSEEGSADAHQQPRASQSLREGVLLLHRGGLASFRWVKYGCVLAAAAPLLHTGCTAGFVQLSRRRAMDLWRRVQTHVLSYKWILWLIFFFFSFLNQDRAFAFILNMNSNQGLSLCYDQIDTIN